MNQKVFKFTKFFLTPNSNSVNAGIITSSMPTVISFNSLDLRVITLIITYKNN